MSDEDSIATVRISHIGLFWNRDLVQRYAFPGFSDIFRCFARQEHDCSSAVHPLPHCIIQLTHIQKVVTKEQGLQLQIYSTRGLTPMWPNALSGLYLISTNEFKEIPDEEEEECQCPFGLIPHFYQVRLFFRLVRRSVLCQCPLGLIPHFYYYTYSN